MAQKIVALPADIFFDQDECNVLVAYQNKSNAKTKGKKQDRCVQTPNLREAIRLVAKFGGFLGRKSDGEPGTETLWRGLQRLDGMTEGWRLANDP